MNPKLEPTGPNKAADLAADKILESVREERGDIEKEKKEEEERIERLERTDKLIEDNQKFLDKFDEDKAKKLHAELDPKDWGPDQRWQEIHNAMNRGLGTAEEALVTFPERALDMIRGEEVGDEDYEPEWNPYKNVEHPITKTWCGSLRWYCHTCSANCQRCFNPSCRWFSYYRYNRSFN